jgi:hypothetical protein
MRYKQINKYGSKMIMEQEVPEVPSPEEELPLDPATSTDGELPADPAMATGDETPMDVPADDSTEEIDITDLVNMTKSIKNNIDDNKADQVTTLNKMDDIFGKLVDLEAKLGEMDQVVAKIDLLGTQVQQMKPETPQEKLEMRSLDSYPFNQRPTEYFSQKQGEMRASGKNEYILTKQDVESYSPDTISKTFNPQQDEDEFKY